MKISDMKVSVIIPCYNVSEYLPKLFDSIQKQTQDGIEYIFVDDGSPDNSGKMLEEFCSKYTKVFRN